MTLADFVAKNLFRKRLRTVLTSFAIFVAFLIFGVLGTFRNALNAGIDMASASRLVVTNKINFTLPMPFAYVQRTAAVEGVENVSHAVWFGGYFQEPRNFLVAFAVDPASYLAISPEYVLAPAQQQAFLSDRGSMAAGKTLAETYGWKVGDRIPLKSNIWRQRNGSDTWHLTLAGTITGTDERVDTNFVIFHYENFKETRSFGGDTTGWMIVKTKDPAHNERIIRTIDAAFANSPFETETKTEQAFNKAFIEQAGDLGFIITAVVGAAFATILLIAGNTMMLTVRERSKEIAVLKTLGFTTGRIFAMTLGESLMLAAMGGVLGTLAAWAAAQALQGATAGMFGPMTFSPSIAAASFGLTVLLGVLTGLLPALQAMRINVAAALGGK